MNLTKLLSFFIVLLVAITASEAEAYGFKLFRQGVSTTQAPLARDIYVYTPPGYEENQNQYYPVIYMHDGQNLFDPTRAYLGQTWHAEESLNYLILSHQMKPVIVVAVDNTPDRINEYTFDRDASVGAGGQALHYLNFLAYQLRPLINQNFRTIDNRENTALIGSSLGGLVSLYGACQFSETFGLVAALSPSIWWNNQSIVNMFKTSRKTNNCHPEKIYLDSGTDGGEKPNDVISFSSLLSQLGYSEGRDLKIIIQDGAVHSEVYWAQRFPQALHFLFPNN